MLENNLPTTDANILGTLAACHWSYSMLCLMRTGLMRPGAMRRALPGLTQKVQTACLQRMTRFGLLTRTPFGEVPPRVEYNLTPIGHEYVALLDGLKGLEARLSQDSLPQKDLPLPYSVF